MAGEMIIVGLSSVQCARTNVAGVETIVRSFLQRLRSVPELKPLLIVPIIETNGSEIVASSIAEIFYGFPPYNMPWKRQVFQKNISEGIGVITTHEVKVRLVPDTCGWFLLLTSPFR